MTQTRAYASPTSGQLGAAAELITAARLMLASAGRLSCFIPLIDDDAIDLLVRDRVTGAAAGLQVKSWTFRDGDRPRTVQFDIRKATWREDPGLYLLAVAIDGATALPETVWLIPSAEVAGVANHYPDRMTLTPSPRADSRDRYTRYRLTMREAAERLLPGP